MIRGSGMLALAAIGVGVAVVPPVDPPLIIWNASASVPLGLYAVEPPIALRVADLVIVRPPEPLAEFLADRAYLPRGVPLLKHILALYGQSVCRDALAVTIDGTAVGVARERDSRGRPLPSWSGCRTLGQDEIFLLNPRSADSLDGRYFGLLPASSVVGRAIPIWTIGEE
jgi:conjugative transfer signal peptidase TraF